ncbi:MAG: hypothetical protein J7M14_01565 [Planctomycetes bacterium]|nr:hypothetical protein [Planctomycetota bacterium]
MSATREKHREAPNGLWLTGDLHIHSACDSDGHLSVSETIARSRRYCQFFAISGHARGSDDWGHEQYAAVPAAREQFPDVLIFHTGEIEFPIERHAMVVTAPCEREFELQRELVRRFDRRRGCEGPEAAMELLRFVEDGWGDKAFMVFNHPNAPDVSFADLELLSRSDVFKVIACYDRGERRASQTWDVGAEWDRLLMRGRRIWVRFGSDFHRHFTDGGRDYYPGEFVQDQVFAGEKSYGAVVEAYRSGSYFCTVDNIVSHLRLDIVPGGLKVSFRSNEAVERFEIIADGRIVATVAGADGAPAEAIAVPAASYYRVRGFGFSKARRYSEGTYVPCFLSNPVFSEDA